MCLSVIGEYTCQQMEYIHNPNLDQYVFADNYAMLSVRY